MPLSESRKSEIVEEEKLRLQARREAWKELYAGESWHGHAACYGGRRHVMGRLLFWGLAITTLALIAGHGVCHF